MKCRCYVKKEMGSNEYIRKKVAEAPEDGLSSYYWAIFAYPVGTTEGNKRVQHCQHQP